MIRLLPACLAVVVFVLPLFTSPMRTVAVIGLIGLLLSAVAIMGRRRWAATAAACVFVVEYAGAVWITTAPVRVLHAIGFGLALVFFLEAVDVAYRAAGATVEAMAVYLALGRWIGIGVATLVAAAVAVPLASALAMAVPAVIAPVVTALAALAALVMLAALIRGAATTR